MAETTLTPSRMWKTMTIDERQRVARAFWSDTEATDDQVQATLLIAQQKKFRPKTIVGLDLDRKARHLATLASLPDPLAARALLRIQLALGLDGPARGQLAQVSNHALCIHIKSHVSSLKSHSQTP
jgi:hypothetical protein